MKKIANIFTCIVLSIMFFSCNDDDQSKTNCDQKPEWVGYDDECGCFGEPIGFSERCITFFQESDVAYFGYINYGHVKDSVLIILKNDKNSVDIVTLSDIPSVDVQGSEFDWYLENQKPMQLLYDDTHWNNPEALGRATEVRLDPNVLLAEPDQFSIGLYQREFLTLGATILDSTAVMVIKDVGRR